MAFETERNVWAGSGVGGASIDVGLRQYMLKVYNYMASGLALTGLVAALVAHSPAMMQLLYAPTSSGHMGLTGLGWLFVLAPIGLVFALSMGIARMQASTAQGLFWLYAGLMGVSLSSIFMVYTGTSITRVFFVTAASFAGLSLYGYTTRRSLNGFASFLIMGLIGVMIAGLVNMFLQSSMLYFIQSAVGVLVFAGLTAYDTQKIKEMYWQGDGAEIAGKKAVMGALSLYLDFINLFLMLLRFFGDRRN
jgi:FtsH-binding integral membrane protein